MSDELPRVRCDQDGYSPWFHARQQVLDDPSCREEIDLEDAFAACHRWRYASGMCQYADPSTGKYSLQPVAERCFGYITGNEGDFGMSAKCRSQRIEFLGVQVAQDQWATFPRESVGDCGSHAPSRTCDNCDPAGPIRHDRFFGYHCVHVLCGRCGGTEALHAKCDATLIPTSTQSAMMNSHPKANGIPRCAGLL